MGISMGLIVYILFYNYMQETKPMLLMHWIQVLSI